MQLEIKAVKFALSSFSKFRKKEEERVAFLDSQLETVQYLEVYSDFPKDKLQDALNKLQEKENLLLANPNVDLRSFLWKETQAVTNVMFPEHWFGQYVLKRDGVVKRVKEAIALQLALRPEASQSVYLSGCRGSGKTSLLILLARALTAEGYEVYFFRSARDIPQRASLAFEALLENNTKKVAVLIDEVTADPDAGLFITLLKNNYPHLVTIGAAVPNFFRTGLSSVFKTALRMTDLVLKEDDGDFQELIKHCEGLKATKPEPTRVICKYLLKQCGGHTFPTLAFIEHFFTRDDAKGYLSSLEEFRRYFCGADFAQSSFYKSVRDRCFVQLLDAETERVAFRVLGGQVEAGDINSMTRLGWWDPHTRDFISRFLVNACLSAVQPGTDGVLYLDEKKTPEENAELVIVEGLQGMEDSDFKCWRHKSGVKVENGVSFNWAYKARVKIPNAYLQFQERAESGVVDFYLNGFADTAIEVMLDATKTVRPNSTRQSQDIDGHQERLRNDKYDWKRYVLFNFAMTQDAVVLPRDTSAHDKVYTYVRSTNTLYRGAKLLKSPAIPNLSGGSRRFTGVPTRSFSTMLRATRPRDGRPLALSTLKHFMTLVKGW